MGTRPNVNSRVRIELAPKFALFIDEHLVEVSRPQVRTVLAILATSSGPVSGDYLEEALWPDSLPANPESALRTIISRSRSVLEGASDSLVAKDGVCWLESDSDWGELKRLTESNPSETPSTVRLEAFLRQSSGVPFAGITDSEVIGARRIEFERLRTRVERNLLDRYFTEGRYEDAVLQALTFLDHSPEDELVSAVAARALGHLGRKTQGLELLQRTRSALVLRGLDPSGELQDVEAELLATAEGLRQVSPPQVMLPTGGLVGRDAQLTRFSQLGPGETLLVEGEPGIGKSSLLGVYAERCQDAGVQVVTVKASASASSPMGALSTLVEHLLDLDGVTATEDHLASLSVLLPNLGDESTPPTSREGLVAGVVDFIIDAVEATRVVLAIDDAQWLDLASGLVLRALIRSKRCRLLILARQGWSQEFLADAAHLVEVIELGPLEQADTESLVAQAAPDLPSSASAARLHDWSGGNPFFLGMLVDLIEQEIDIDESLPPIVLDATQRRMEVLSHSSRRVLQKASVVGTSFDEAAVALLDESAQRGLAEAAEAGLIERRTGGQSVFRHAIVADAAYQLLGEADRIGLHDQVGRILEARGAEAIVVFEHAREAVSLDGWRAGDLALSAAVQHLRAFQWEAAAEVATWGLAHGLAPRQYRLRIARSRAEIALGVPHSQLSLLASAREAMQEGDSEALVDATIELSNSGSVALTGIDVESVKELVDAALVVAGEVGRLDELRASTARAFVYSRFGAFGQEQYAKAFANYENLDLPVQELILRNSEAGLSNPRDFGLAQRTSTLLSDAADRSPELRWLARWFQFRDALIAGDGERLAWALRDLRKAAAGAERRHTFVILGQTFDMDMQRSWAEAAMALIHQDFDTAERFAEQALATGLEQLAIRGDGFGEGWVLNSYGLLLLAIRHAQGRLAELVDIVETSAPLVPAWRVAIVITNHAAGNSERVREELAVLSAKRFEALVPDPTWTAAVHLLADPVVAHGNPETVQHLYELIEPYQDRMSYSGLCTFGPLGDSCAQLADALGMTDAAAFHRQQATRQLVRLRERSRWAFDEGSG